MSALIEVTSYKLLLSLFHCKVVGNIQVIYMTECYEITQGMVTSNTLKTQIERSPSFLLSQKKRLNKFSEA